MRFCSGSRFCSVGTDVSAGHNLQVNARAPVAQVYDDKSILENFHTVTLIHMLRKFRFDEFLGGDFGCLGDAATPFRRVLESSILATDMSRHFAFVTDLTEMKKRIDAGMSRSEEELEADRLLLCAGLIKCADISNPVSSRGAAYDGGRRGARRL